MVKLHQDYPSYVIECDGASIAMDAEVARSINVWLEGAAAVTEDREPRHRGPNFAKPWWRWRLGGRARGN